MDRRRSSRTLVEPLGYRYMVDAIWASALVGAVCAFLSCYLMLKGWSLIGDALSHSVVPGVAGAYMLGLPYSVGAFISGGARRGRDAVRVVAIHAAHRTRSIGLIFTGFFGLGLFHGVAVADVGEHPDHRVRQHPGDHARSTRLQLAIIGGVTLDRPCSRSGRT